MQDEDHSEESNSTNGAIGISTASDERNALGCSPESRIEGANGSGSLTPYSE